MIHKVKLLNHQEIKNYTGKIPLVDCGFRTFFTLEKDLDIQIEHINFVSGKYWALIEQDGELYGIDSLAYYMEKYPPEGDELYKNVHLLSDDVTLEQVKEMLLDTKIIKKIYTLEDVIGWNLVQNSRPTP